MQEFLTRLQETIKDFTLPQVEKQSLEAIAKQMSYKDEDVQEWWSGVRWVQDQRQPLPQAQSMLGQNTSTQTVSKAVLNQTLNMLEKAGVVKSPSNGWDLTLFTPADRQSD